MYSNGRQPQRHAATQKKRNERRCEIAILLVALALRAAFAILLPAWGSPDEYPHYWTADQIARTGSLPQSRPEFPRYESFQPPLYYALAAGVLRLTGPGDRTLAFDEEGLAPPAPLLWLRLFALLIGLLTLIVVRGTLEILPNLTPTIRLGSLAFIAFLPTYVGITSSVNNDALVILFAAILIRFSLQPLPSRRDLMIAGGAAGLALLTKLSAIIVLPILLIPILRAYRHSRRELLSTTLTILLSLGIGAGLLLARNLIQYHSPTAVMPGLEQKFTADPINLLHAVRNLFWSFWVAFGRTYQIHPSSALYLLFFAPLVPGALIGSIRAFRLHASLLFPTFLLIGFGLLLSLAFTLSYPPGTMTSWGKNLYPLLPLIAPAFVIGWENLQRKREGLFTAIGIAVLLGFSLWGLVAIS